MAIARELSQTFAAGTLGGLVNSLFLWAIGQLGVTAALGVKIAPALSPPWLYQRLVWGGIWGLVLLLPFLRQGSPLRAGFIASLGPTLAQLFYVFPHMAHQGVGGVELGLLTPLVVVVVNAVWGWAAVVWSRAAR
jgi:hypothetical protein